MNKMPIVIGIGELLWDILPTGKKAGGAPINFAYHASRLGVQSYAISAVGKDYFGDEILQVIEKTGISHIIERVDYPTGTVQIELNDGIPNYNIIEGVAWDHIPLTNDMIQLAKQADAICFGTLAQRSKTSRESIQKLLSYIPNDSYRIYDINIRQYYYSKEIIISSLNNCNVMEKFNLKYLILTAGADYSIVLSPSSCSKIKTPNVNIVDTVGAGDSFTGAFISSLLEGKSLSEAHQNAVDRAAYVCTQAGAWV